MSDHYESVLSALQADTLVTFNASDPTATESGELVVMSTTDDGEVTLRDYSGQIYEVENQGEEYHLWFMKPQGGQRHYGKITTVEVVGIN